MTVRVGSGAMSGEEVINGIRLGRQNTHYIMLYTVLLQGFFLLEPEAG